MANLPALQADSTDALANLLVQGRSPTEIARQIHPKDRTARKRTRRQLESRILTDDNVSRRLTEKLKLKMLIGLGPAIVGLNRRAEKGNVMAIKLALEASGFHNPKVQHQHSGEITIKLDMPRPTFVDAASDGEVADAEVVD